jgi:hypothetical protein
MPEKAAEEDPSEIRAIARGDENEKKSVFAAQKLQVCGTRTLIFLKWGKPQPLHQNNAYGFY